MVGEGRPGDGGPVVLAAGSRIAGYLLEEEIGAGGMAVVFRARDERLARPVALKVVAPGLAGNEQFRRRFLRESRAAAAVDDPHILPVYQAGQADGGLFLAMRYVSGGDVRGLLRRQGPLPPGRAAVIISPVACALDAAHGAGLVHRDVKPANVLIDARPGRPDHVYLSDFGLARSGSASVLTGAGVGLGTVAYMAPEQIQGQAVDGRADQYALGCAAFELLCGEVPFERDQDMAVIYAHLSVPPPSLSARHPGLPSAVDEVLGRALAKAPGDRYASCREFAEALREALGLPGYDRDPEAVPAPTAVAARQARAVPGAVAGATVIGPAWAQSGAGARGRPLSGGVGGACAGCGRDNPPDARFCNGCGAALAADSVPRQKRKTVTILFCDVTGSTALGERLDPESFRQVMRRYFDTARAVIERHGGTVEKFVGDAVMAVFGVPVLHEDDALRAVRAAAGLGEEIALLNTELEVSFGATVSVGIGVNTGQVVVGTEERLATGDAVNLAARLEQAAGPGEIVIGPQTWRLVRDAVVTEPLEPLRLKGKSQPVTAFRLLQIRGDVDPRARRGGAPLVGRASQLRILGEAFANVVRERSCGLFTVLGMAGVGKSRLAAEFLRGVDARVVTGPCLSYGQGITYWPVVSMAKQLLDSQRGCAGAAELMAGDAKAAAAINVLLGEQAAVTSPSEIAWAVRKLFESSAELRPLAVVFDDLHWGAPPLFDLVEHIADLSRSAPILVICLARPELLDSRPGWGGGKLNATTLLLEPLQPADTAVLIDELVPAGRGLDPRLRERVQVTAGGNPLFVEEMLALISESDSGELAVPATIAALLAARLDQLPAAERTVLECGSVEGQSFHQGTVEVMAPEEQDVPGRLMALVHKDLVRPDRAVWPGQEAFRFRHLLIRDAAYQALSKTDRAELHERFARWLEVRGAGLVELDEITAYHLEQAFGYRCELGPADDGAQRLAADAAAHLEVAGRRAMDRGDTGAAVNLLERAEVLLPPRELNLAVQLSLTRGLAESGKLDDAISRGARIAGQCSAAGDRVGELRARLEELRWRASADPERWLAALAALVKRARLAIEQDGDPAAQAALEQATGFLDYNRGRQAAALAALTRGMEYARQAGDLWLETSMRAMAATCIYLGPTPISKALRWLDDAKAQSAAYQPQLDTRKAALLAELGRFGEARSLLSETIAQLNERGLALLAGYAMQTAWRIEMLAGDDAAAERVARRGCEQLDNLDEHAFLSTQSCQLADALYALGRYEESEQWARRGLQLGSSDDVATQFLGLSVRSRVSARTGDISTALALADQVDRLAATSDDPRDPADAALNRAEITHLAGDRGRASELIGQAIEHYQRKESTAYIARAHRLAAQWAIAT